MDSISKYFNAEKNESILFIVIGVLALCISSYFIFKLKQHYFNGMSYSFIAIALIQITVGLSIFIRSPKDILRVNQIVQTNKTAIKTDEIPRMNKVMSNFILYRWIEIALIVVGIVLYFVFQTSSIYKGIGLGLIIQSSFMLILDYFAENRGKIYLEYLKSLMD